MHVRGLCVGRGDPSCVGWGRLHASLPGLTGGDGARAAANLWRRLRLGLPVGFPRWFLGASSSIRSGAEH